MELKKDYIILGLDNSSGCTGWSIVKVINGNQMQLIDYGMIPTKGDYEKVLITIEQKYIEIIEKYKPDYIAAEQMFVSRNRRTAMTLAYIHGIMLLTAAKYKIPVTYYAVMTMKSTVLGGIKTKNEDGTKKNGEEMKEEVKAKIIEIFGESSFKKEFTNDVTDSISAIVTFVLTDGEGSGKKKKPKKETAKKEKKTTK